LKSLPAMVVSRSSSTLLAGVVEVSECTGVCRNIRPRLKYGAVAVSDDGSLRGLDEGGKKNLFFTSETSVLQRACSNTDRWCPQHIKHAQARPRRQKEEVSRLQWPGPHNHSERIPIGA